MLLLHAFEATQYVPVADMMGVANWAPWAFLLVLTNTPLDGNFGLVHGSSLQNKWETLWSSVGHGGHTCTSSSNHSYQYVNTWNLKIFIFLYIPCLISSQPIDPEDIAVVAVGSSKEVVFNGGPQPWVLDSSKYSQKCKSRCSCLELFLYKMLCVKY